MKSYDESYDEYLRSWTHAWALKISRRAGVEPGKGGRGKKDDPARRLAQRLGIGYGSWLKYKAGTHAPNSSTLKVVHEKAISLGLLGQGDSLEAAQESLGPLSAMQWLPGLTLEELAELEMNALRWEADPQAQEDAMAALVAYIQINSSPMMNCANLGTMESNK